MDNGMFDNEKEITQAVRLVPDSAGKLWWAMVVLLILCMYWLSNVVLWLPWSYNPHLGIVLMLTVNPVFWGVGIYRCLACKGGMENLMKKTLVVAVIAVGISLVSDFLFFAVLMGSKDVWHITTFYGYAWLVVLAFGEAFLFRKRLAARQVVAGQKTLFVLAACLLLLLSLLICLM